MSICVPTRRHPYSAAPCGCVRFSSKGASMKRFSKTISVFLVVVATALGARAQDPDQITAADIAGSHVKFTPLRVKDVGQNGTRMKSTRLTAKNDGQNGTTQATLPGIAGIDSVPNFSGAFTAAGVDPNGVPQDNWIFNTLGNPPAAGRPTSTRPSCQSPSIFATTMAHRDMFDS